MFQIYIENKRFSRYRSLSFNEHDTDCGTHLFPGYFLLGAAFADHGVLGADLVVRLQTEGR